jgi:methyltransferase family protein
LPDHRAYMAEMAKRSGWQRGIELGLGTGLLFGRFLDLGLEMVGVDLGRRPDRRAAVEALGGGRVLWMPTAQAAHHVADGWADFVFIDAAHSYLAVKADIERWRAKVRPGGWFGGHDYHPKFPGVIRAVDDAFPDRVLHPHWIWSAT